MTSVLVTGGAGFVGSHLVERCLALGWQVTAVDAFTDYYDPSLKQANVDSVGEHDGLTWIESDLLDLNLGPLLHEVDTVIHLSAQPGVRASWETFGLYTQRNLEVTQRLLHAAVDTPVRRVVLASSSSVYGDAETMPTPELTHLRPVSPYGITKAATEHLAQVYWRTFGVRTVCLRYFTVYGPRQRPDMAFNRLIASALTNAPFTIFGDGEQTRDFTFVADAVTGTLAAVEHGKPGAIYNIGGGSRRSMNSVVRELSGALGRQVECVYQQRQAGDARDTAADITLAGQELGFAPAVSFEDGLRAQLDWQLNRSRIEHLAGIPSIVR